MWKISYSLAELLPCSHRVGLGDLEMEGIFKPPLSLSPRSFQQPFPATFANKYIDFLCLAILLVSFTPDFVPVTLNYSKEKFIFTIFPAFRYGPSFLKRQCSTAWFSLKTNK
jgi:hypothetical protein